MYAASEFGFGFNAFAVLSAWSLSVIFDFLSVHDQFG